MRKLVLSCESHLKCNAERFDSHDRDRSGGRADRQVDQRILLAVLWRDFVDHQDGEHGNEGAIEKEAFAHKLGIVLI